MDWTSLLGQAHRRAVGAALRAAREQGAALYLVGGTVRDMLLGKQPKDLDLMIEGDPRRFARAMAALLKAQWRYEPRFLTGCILFGGHAIDIARARRETYPRPGALPRVSPVHVDEDIMRRDFSINAMFFGLTGIDSGKLFGPYGFRRDVQARILRVLHERSFTDDPTRVLRGIRLAARLGFSFERRTRRLAIEAVGAGALGTVSADRIRQEMLLLLDEPEPARALEMGRRLGVTAAVLPGMRTGARLRGALERARDFAGRIPEVERGDVLLLALLAMCARPLEAARRLGLSGSALEAARAAAALRGSLPARIARARPSAATRMLERVPLPAVIALAATTRSSLSLCQMARYLSQWRLVKPKIGGADLLAMGFKQGPALGAALRAVRDACLDGEARTRRTQVQVALIRLRGVAVR